MSRFRAAGIHLLLSALIALTVLALMIGVWYPGAYFRLMGGADLLFIMVGVDVCLGPLLTLAVFKVGKRGLKFDLTVIALAQFAALSYGVFVMFEVRPVYTVFVKDRFQVAMTLDIDPKELARAKLPEWRHFSLTGPVVVAAIEPADLKEKNELVDLALAGIDWHQLPRLYVQYESQRENILRKAKPLSSLRDIAKGNPAEVAAFLKKQSRPEQEFVYVPILTTHAEMAVVLDRNTAKIVGIINAAP